VRRTTWLGLLDQVTVTPARTPEGIRAKAATLREAYRGLLPVFVEDT
jgi:hypothetical protein